MLRNVFLGALAASMAFGETQTQSWGSIFDLKNQYDFVALEPTIELTGSIVSMTADISWKDQGWGNSKGNCRAVVYREGEAIFGVDLFGFAPQKTGQKFVSFDERSLFNYYTQAGDVLEISYTVGGGGGHSLFISQLDVEVTTGEKTVMDLPKFVVQAPHVDHCPPETTMIEDPELCSEAAEMMELVYDPQFEEKECLQNTNESPDVCHIAKPGGRPGTPDKMRIYDCHWMLNQFVCLSGGGGGQKEYTCDEVNDKSMDWTMDERGELCNSISGCKWKGEKKCKKSKKVKKEKCKKLGEDACKAREDCRVKMKRGSFKKCK